MKKGHKEAFARFFEQPSREALRDLLRDQSGETEFLDFKQDWPAGSKLTKQVLGFANTGNGCLVIGMSEQDGGGLLATGLTKITDKANIINDLKKYLTPELLQRTHIFDYTFEDAEYAQLKGKIFQVLLVEYSAEHIPILPLRSGDGLRDTAVYVRREGQTEEATHHEFQQIINTRIETRYSSSDEISLKQHMEQLKVLYSELPRHGKLALMAMGSYESVFGVPKDADGDSYAGFVESAIAAKKKIIMRALGASPAMQEAQKLLLRSKGRSTTTAS